MAVVKPVWLKRFRGVCQRAISDTIPMGYLEDALNYEIDIKGSLAPRTGFRLLASAAAPDGKPIRKIQAIDWDGSTRIIVATTHNVYEYVQSSDTWTSIYTIVNTTADRMTFALLNAATSPTLVFGNGADPLQKWTGTGASSACTGAPAGRPIEFKNYLAVFGIAGQPGRVQFSISPGDPDTWLYGGVARFLEMRGTVTGLFVYSGGLVVFTNTRMAIFTGDPDMPSGLTTLSETTGLVAHEACADCGGLLIWLSQQSVTAWDGAGRCPTMNISNPDQPDGTPRSSINLDGAAWDQPQYFSALYESTRKRFWLSCKTRATAAGETAWRTFVYDIARASWFPWDTEITSAAPAIISALNNREYILAGTEAGELRIHVGTQMTDDTIGAQEEYEYWAIQPDHDFGEPNVAKIMRGITIGSTGTIGEIATGQKSITITLKGEFSRLGHAPAGIDINAGGFIIGVGILDNDAGTYPGATPLGEGEKYHEKFTPLALRSKHFSVMFSGQGTANAAAISAIGYHVRPSATRTILVKE